MKSKLYLGFFFLSICLFCLPKLAAQDIHFTQFYNSPQNLNPALTGMMKEDVRFIGHYRNQWQSVPVPYLTFSGSYDTKLLENLTKNGFFGLGAVFNYDRQGLADLRLSQLSVSGSYTQRVSEFNYLTAGIQLGTINRAFKMDELQFENQYNGDIFDPQLPTRENFENTNITFLDFGAGLNWHFQTTTGVSFDIGTGMYHLTRPAQNFYNQTDANLSFRHTAYGIGQLPLNDKLDLHVRLVGQFQGAYQEFLVGTAISYHLNKSVGQETAISIGTNFRSADGRDAVSPTIGLRYLMWQVEFSYDANISPFKQATGGQGGPEVSVRYAITKVKPPNTFKACPIF